MKLYEPKKSSKSKIEKYRANGGLYCIDYAKANISLYSSWIYDDDNSALDIMAVPCGLKPEGFEEPIREDCVWEKDKVE